MDTLRLGRRSPAVTQLQHLLNEHDACPRLEEDGVFGPETWAAVIAFQARQGMVPDGIVDPAIWAGLGITDCSYRRDG